MSSIAGKVDSCQETQDILQAAEAASVLEAALAYNRLGYAALPIARGEKYPAGIVGWQNLGRLSDDQLRAYYETGDFDGVGIRAGVMSNGLAEIDCDSPERYTWFCKQFPELADTYTEKTRRGYHILIEVEQTPAYKTGKLKVGDIEVFYNTGFCVVSPSPHKDGGRYMPHKRLPVKRVRNIDALFRWMLAQQNQKNSTPVQQKTTQTVTSAADVWAAIERAAGIAHYDADGWSAFIPCPFARHEHDGHEPKFGLHQDGYGHCFKCDRTASTKDLAEAYGIASLTAGIEWPKAKSLIETPHDTPAPVFAEENKEASHAAAPPDTLLYACWNFAPPGIVPVLSLIYAAGLTDQPFTVNDLLEPNLMLGYGIAERSLRLGVEKLLECEFLQKLEIKEKALSITSNSCKNAKLGRNCDTYQLCSKAEIIEQLVRLASPRLNEQYHPVDDELSDDSILAHVTPGMMEAIGVEGEIAGELNHALHSAYDAQQNRQDKAQRRAFAHRRRLIGDLHDERRTSLAPNWPKSNDANFKAAHLRGYIEANPDAPLSRRQMIERYGIADSSVKELRRRAGVEAERQAPLHVPVKTTAELDTQIRQFGRTHNAYALKVVSQKADGSAREWYYQKDTAPELVANELASGAQVSVEFSLPNKHRVAEIEPPAKPERKPDTAKAIESRPPVAASAPHQERYYGKGYNPRWVGAQMKLALKLLGWQAISGRLVNTDTGEYAPDEPRQIVEILIGHPLPAADTEESWEGFLTDAAEFGAVVSMSERAA